MAYKKKQISKTVVKATSRLEGVNEIDKKNLHLLIMEMTIGN